jgi:hypothetical protein
VSGPVRIEPDGTRVYAHGYRYRPKPPEERTYAVRKPDDPRAVRFRGDWYLPLDLVEEGARVMPATRPDSDAYDHMDRTVLCRCEVCRRPAAERWRNKWRADHGLRRKPVRASSTSAPGPASR